MSRRQTPPRVCRAPPRASRCLSVCLGAGPGPRRRVGTHAEARRKLVLIFGDPRDRVGHQMTAQVNGERFKRKRILHRRETRFEARERSPVEKNRNAKKSSLALGRPRPRAPRARSRTGALLFSLGERQTRRRRRRRLSSFYFYRRASSVDSRALFSSCSALALRSFCRLSPQ